MIDWIEFSDIVSGIYQLNLLGMVKYIIDEFTNRSFHGCRYIHEYKVKRRDNQTKLFLNDLQKLPLTSPLKFTFRF